MQNKMTELIPAKLFEGELWVKASDHQRAIKEALAQPSGSVEQEPTCTTPPQRTWGKPWVSLTDKEIRACNQTTTDEGTSCIWIWDDDFEESGIPFAKAIEAKLKEKNT